MRIKGYPAAPHWIIILLVVATLLLVGAFLSITLLNVDLIGRIITALSMCTLSAMIAAFSIKFIVDRYEIISNVVKIIGPLVIVDNANLPYKDRLRIRSLPDDLIDDVVNKLKGKVYYNEELYNFRITSKPLEPITFCYIKSPGEVSFRMGGIEHKAKGLAYSSYIEIEWQKDFNDTYQLIRHEVGHILFNGSPISRQTEEQHKLMRLAGF